jgi:hypothetical protein
MSKRSGIMQRKKCEQFPIPASGDGKPKNISRTHIPCKLQSHVLNTASMKRWWGEKFHLYRTAYRNFTYKCTQNMLLVTYAVTKYTKNKYTSPNSCFTPPGRLVEHHEYMKRLEVEIKDDHQIYSQVLYYNR